eukprot:15482426-Alexandrium_andersonii.AAC.1
MSPCRAGRQGQPRKHLYSAPRGRLSVCSTSLMARAHLRPKSGWLPLPGYLAGAAPSQRSAAISRGSIGGGTERRPGA